MEKKRDWLDGITLLIMFITGVIPTIILIQTSSSEIKIQTYVIFGILALFLLIGGFVAYIMSKWNNMGKNIEQNKTDLEDIKKDLNFKDLWNKMDIRLKVLENICNTKNKIGAIDPRIIFWILLLFLLYLFLKSVGFF